ncbi:(2Fe-2S)-binding protein [Planctomicrobium sp. SH668]|uniref:(2Fe-2S)-binding protein n=1 Tax=Planctomicrobium sp. SH668 TaxID=3448126 RepID=UPI003F5BD488
MKLDDKVCYCFHISKRKVLNFIRIHQPRRASQLSDCGGAGTGCGWCIRYLQKCFTDAGTIQAAGEDSLTAEEYAAGRTEYILAGKGVPRPGTGPEQNNPSTSPPP